MHPNKLLRLLVASSVSIASLVRISAQTSPDSNQGKAQNDEVVALSSFTVNEKGAKPYRANQSSSATRVAIPIERIPQVITVLTGEMLKDLNINGSDEAIAYAGGEKSKFQDTEASIRGFQALFQIDNMAWGTDIKMDSIIWDRIDVVKGPSGTMFGVGAPGGAINLVTKQPQAKTKGSFHATYGSRGAYRFDSDFTGSIDKDRKWQYRLSAATNKTVSTQLFGQQTLETVMPQLAWHPSSKTVVSVQAIYQNTPNWQPWDERFPQYRALVQPPNPNYPVRMAAAGFVVGTPENFTIPGPNSQRHDRMATITAVWTQAIGANIDSNLRYRHSKFSEPFRSTRFLADSVTSETGIPPNPNLRVRNFIQKKYITNEMIQEDINFRWATHKLNGNVVVGANYSGRDSDNLIFTDIPSGSKGLIGNTINIQNPSPNANDPMWLFGTTSVNFLDPAVYQQYNLTDEINHSERASTWIASNIFFASNRGNILVGFRRSFNINNKSSNVYGSRYNYTEKTLRIVKGSGATTHLDTYMAGGTFEILKKGQDNLVAFMTASEANDFNRYPFDPKLARGYEGGLRFTVLNERLGGSVSYFYNDNTNLPRNDPNRSNELTVSGRELGQGTEVILYYYPIEGATIYLDYVNLNSEILSNIQAPWLEGGIAGDGGAVSHSLSGVFKYKVPSGLLRGASLTLGLRYRTEQAPFPGDPQLFAIRVPGFVTLDVNAWYPMSRGRKMDVGLMAGVRNLTDKFYMQGAMMVAQGRSFWAGISSKY